MHGIVLLFERTHSHAHTNSPYRYYCAKMNCIRRTLFACKQLQIVRIHIQRFKIYIVYFASHIIFDRHKTQECVCVCVFYTESILQSRIERNPNISLVSFEPFLKYLDKFFFSPTNFWDNGAEYQS